MIDLNRDGVRADIPEDVYHADRASLSASGAKLLLPPSTPAKFRETMDNPPKPKSVYTFGHAAHRLVLGKGAEIIEVDAPDWKTKAAQEIRNTAANGVAPMLTHELDKARAMAAVVKSHPVAGPWFAEGQGHSEVSLYATDEQTGVRLRGRTDRLTHADGRLLIIDYKTAVSADPAEWIRTWVGYKVHLQFAWYKMLIRLLKIDAEPDMVFVVQEKEPPYLVKPIRLDTEAFDLGRLQMRQAINTFAQCTETNEWPGYGDEIVTMPLPMWAFDDQEIVI